MIKLLVTDLDDTLYSWIDFFIPAFYGMVDELSLILNVPKSDLLNEYQQVHQKKGSVEYPFATLLLPSVKIMYPNKTKEELLNILNPAFHRFNSIRKRKLELYPDVRETLKEIAGMGIKIVGYTDSAEENGFYRLKRLEIDNYFQRVYVSDSQFERPDTLPSSEKTEIVQGKKPNPGIIKKICFPGRKRRIYEIQIYFGKKHTYVQSSDNMYRRPQHLQRCVRIGAGKGKDPDFLAGRLWPATAGNGNSGKRAAPVGRGKGFCLYYVQRKRQIISVKRREYIRPEVIYEEDHLFLFAVLPLLQKG